MTTSPITRRQWAAIADAEEELYGSEGTHAYTEVNEWSDQSPLVAEMWAWAELNIDATCDTSDDAIERESVIGQRVAVCLATMAFGPEFVGEQWADVSYLGYGEGV